MAAGCNEYNTMAMKFGYPLKHCMQILYITLIVLAFQQHGVATWSKETTCVQPTSGFIETNDPHTLKSRVKVLALGCGNTQYT